MKSLKMIAVAVVVSWIAFDGEAANAQVYYGYPTAAPLYRPYVPTSLRCGYGVTESYENGAYGIGRAYPVGVPSPLFPAISTPSGQYGRPVYTYPQAGYGVPVFYRPAVTQPAATQYGVPVNRLAYPSAGHFSVEDRFLPSPTSTPQDVNPVTWPASLTNSPFYQSPGTIVPTGGYAPAGSYRTVPVISAPTNNSPFYR